MLTWLNLAFLVSLWISILRKNIPLAIITDILYDVDQSFCIHFTKYIDAYITSRNVYLLQNTNYPTIHCKQRQCTRCSYNRVVYAIKFQPRQQRRSQDLINTNLVDKDLVTSTFALCALQSDLNEIHLEVSLPLCPHPPLPPPRGITLV